MSRWHHRNAQRWRAARLRALERDNWRCQLCSKQLGLAEVDHIKPVSQGGAEFDPANLQTLCRRCHIAKSAAERPGPPPDPERERWQQYLKNNAADVDTLVYIPTDLQTYEPNNEVD